MLNHNRKSLLPWGALSVLGLTFTVASACGQTDSQIGSFEKTVAGGECDTPGARKGLDCNGCICGADLRWACTLIACTDGGAGSGGSGGGAGSGGSSGSSGSSGNAGSGGSAGSPTCAACATPELRWGLRGGFGTPLDSSSLVDCEDYRLARYPDAVLLPPAECSATLTCNPALAAVRSALADPEVEQAFAGAPRFYGYDPRPVDGPVMIVTSQGREVTVGSPCNNDDPACRPTPNGFQALIDALRALDAEMLGRPECANLLRPGQCHTNANCPADRFCKHADNTCSGTGTCAARPTECPELPDNPGCTCDGIFYASACDANADGRQIKDFGGFNDVLCMGSGRCGDHRISGQGDCNTSFGWAYQIVGNGIECREVVGCECIDFDQPCGPDTWLYSTKSICERAHAECNVEADGGTTSAR
jgi:hypothetical protein